MWRGRFIDLTGFEVAIVDGIPAPAMNKQGKKPSINLKSMTYNT
jgi:hypothetical protein